MGAQMPENPERPIEGGGPIEPVKSGEPIAEPAEEVETAQALPMAGKELATKDVVAETAVDVPASVAVPVPEPTPVVAATEAETKRPAAATIRLERKHPLAI